MGPEGERERSNKRADGGHNEAMPPRRSEAKAKRREDDAVA